MGYQERIEQHAAKHGRASAIERARAMVCSWVLGREFGESVESFYVRHPEYAEFETWFKDWQANSSE